MLDGASKAFFHLLAQSSSLKTLASRYGMRRSRSFARRFIAGETTAEAIEAARTVEGRGLLHTLDHLGESVGSLADAKHRGALIGAVSTAQSVGAGLGALLGPVLFKASGLAARLDPIWPGRALSSHLLPVIGAAMALTLAWLASLILLRQPRFATQ
jgi:proline dehydrogenase